MRRHRLPPRRALARFPPAVTLLGFSLLAGCGETPPAPGSGPDGITLREGPPPPPPASCPAPIPGFEIDVVATGLEVPWDMAQAPDGRLFVTERPGRIRVIENGTLRATPWFELDVEHGDEIGLLGIMLAPDFDETGHLFVVSSHFRPEPLGGLPVLGWALRRIRNRLPGDGGTSMITRVQRITDQGGTGADLTPWVDNLPAAIIHAGGALRAHPDGGMLLSLGDAMDPWSAQDPESLRGAILHIPSTSEPPAVRRLRPEDHLVAKGVRNSQGIGFLGTDPPTAVFIDHGPSGLAAEARRQAKDELNVLEPGANYGWPVEAGRFPDSPFRQPVAEWTPAIAPGGLATLPGDGVGGDPDATARVLVTGLRGETLVQVVMVREDATLSWSPTCQHRLLGDEWGRLRAVLAGAEGEVYLSTSNRDGRGVPRPGDDRILRLRWH
jgi:aldose sugar dehydrogenase